MSINNLEKIVIGVVTYNRKKLLKELLLLLNDIITNGLFEFSVLIVDNDPQQRSSQAIKEVEGLLNYPIVKYSLNEANLSKARNLCLEKADGDYLAFIDDDDRPHKDYLYQLYTAIKYYNVDVVHGEMNVIVDHISNLKRKFLFISFKRYESGASDYHLKGTGHSMFNLKKVIDTGIRFDNDFAFSGGEDTFFFIMLERAGLSCAWAAKAKIDIYACGEQSKTLVRLKRLISVGITAEKIKMLLNNKREFSSDLIDSIMVDLKYNIELVPIHLYVQMENPELENRSLVDLLYHLGRLLCHFGLFIEHYKKGRKQ